MIPIFRKKLHMKTLIPLLQKYSSSTSQFPEFELPSVTWGAIHGRKEKLISRVIISDHLKSMGIIPDELATIELPSTVEVMQERINFLQKLGLTVDDFNNYPLMLGCSLRMRVGTMIKPLVEFLIGLGIPKRILARMLEKRTHILGYDLEETIKPNVNALISFGVCKEAIPMIVLQYPQIIGLPLKAKLSTMQYFFSLKLKIDPDGFFKVLEKLPQIVNLNQNLMLKPVEFLKGRGIPDSDVARMIVKCPQLLLLRGDVLKNSYYFFKSEMKRGVEELLEFPEYFTYSLESRIKPRYHRIEGKGIKCGLAWFLNCSDKRFEERLEGNYIEGETMGPTFSMGGKLDMPGNELVSEEEEDESDGEVLYRRTFSI